MSSNRDDRPHGTGADRIALLTTVLAAAGLISVAAILLIRDLTGWEQWIVPLLWIDAAAVTVGAILGLRRLGRTGGRADRGHARRKSTSNFYAARL
jgi:hypothetical protein